MKKIKKKKLKLICICILISTFTITINNEQAFLTNSKGLISILLTILGLCFTSFSFISSAILQIFKNSKTTNKNKLLKSVNELLENIESDIFLIFYSIIILTIINLLRFLNIPLIKDPINLDFGIINIISLKNSVFNFITSLSFCLTLYSLYDIMKASFKLIINCYNK